MDFGKAMSEDIAMSSNHELSPGAGLLLQRLQTGDKLSRSWTSTESDAYYTLSVAMFSNAVVLCRSDGGNDDFVVSSALYSVRHGLEVLLKAFVMDREIDALLERVVGGTNLEKLKTAIAKDRDPKKRGSKDPEPKLCRNDELALHRTLCGYKNYHEGLRYPELWQKRIGAAESDKAIGILRANARESRGSFATFWRMALTKHDLPYLWERARRRFVRLASTAHGEVREAGYTVEVLSEEELDSAVSFFNFFDPHGDAFRYPSNREGKPHRMEWVSLDTLGDLAARLEVTARAYGPFMVGERYAGVTIADVVRAVQGSEA